jgi:hypothetical protein
LRGSLCFAFQLQRSGYDLINITKALFSELVSDSHSDRWNKFEFPKLSMRELHALALQRERQLKRWSRAKKLALILNQTLLLKKLSHSTGLP